MRGLRRAAAGRAALGRRRDAVRALRVSARRAESRHSGARGHGNQLREGPQSHQRGKNFKGFVSETQLAPLEKCVRDWLVHSICDVKTNALYPMSFCSVPETK